MHSLLRECIGTHSLYTAYTRIPIPSLLRLHYTFATAFAFPAAYAFPATFPSLLRIREYALSCAGADALKRACTHAYACADACVRHVCFRASLKRTCMHPQLCTHVCAMHTDTRARAHTHTQTQTHKHKHAHTRQHTHTLHTHVREPPQPRLRAADETIITY